MAIQKVLIIDDENLVRLSTSLLLKKKGFEVICAADGTEGLTAADAERPDLIMLDIMMPGMDGWTVLEKLRGNEATREIPVVIFTAGDYSESEKRASEAGVAHVLRKPFHMNELLHVCSHLSEGGGMQ